MSDEGGAANARANPPPTRPRARWLMLALLLAFIIGVVITLLAMPHLQRRWGGAQPIASAPDPYLRGTAAPGIAPRALPNDAAQMLEERLRLLEDEIDAIKGLRVGSLILGVVSTAKYFAPQLMAIFRKQHPDIAIKLAIGNRAETIAALKSHAVDMALMGRPPKDIPLRSTVFGDHPLVMIAAPDHPLAKFRDITKERIAQEHFLVREPGSGTRISLEIFLSELPGRLDDLGTEMSSNETIKQAVMAGLGIGFISAHTIALELEFGKLAILDVIGMPIRRQWFSVVRTDRTLSPAMKAFQDFLTRKGAQFLPSIDRLYPASSALGPSLE